MTRRSSIAARVAMPSEPSRPADVTFSTESRKPPIIAPATPTTRSPIRPNARPLVIRPASQPAVIPIRMNQTMSMALLLVFPDFGANGGPLRGLLQLGVEAGLHLADERFPVAGLPETGPLPVGPARGAVGLQRFQEPALAALRADPLHPPPSSPYSLARP